MRIHKGSSSFFSHSGLKIEKLVKIVHLDFYILGSVMHFVKTQRGGLKLCYNGYVYVKNKDLSSGNKFYECERRRHNNCKAKIILCGEEIISQTHEHTHAADILRQDLLFVREEMKEKAITTQQTSQQIIT